MLGRILSVFVCAALWLPVSAAAEAKVEKLTFGSGGATRTYYLFVPEKTAGGSAPLLLLLHGSGRDGRTLIDPWLPMAKSEGIVLLAPDASNPQAWRMPQEGPDFFHDLVELVRISHDVIDERRMYVFGGGVVNPELQQILTQAPRKIPMAIWVGTNDAFFPLSIVRQTRDALNAHGFKTGLTEIKNHTHNYYGASSSINKEVWAFLKQYKLDADPKFQAYQLIK